MGVCKEKPVTWQNNAEKWLIQKHCNVLGILLLIRQWDCSHCILHRNETTTRSSNKQCSNKKHKEAGEPVSTKAEQQCPVCAGMSRWLGSKKKLKAQKDLTIILYAISIWQTLVLQPEWKPWRVDMTMPPRKWQVLKEYTGQRGRGTALQTGIQTAGANTRPDWEWGHLQRVCTCQHRHRARRQLCYRRWTCYQPESRWHI